MTEGEFPGESTGPTDDALAELRRQVRRVAHDFNNLLTVIAGNVDFARAELAPSHPAARDLAEATAATERATELVRQLIAVSRAPTSAD